MPPTITAFENSPDGGQGMARDMRVRWALEEVGQPYDVRLVTFEEMREPAYLALHPFGQIPAYQDGDLVLFESGAIIFHIAERGTELLPDEPDERARAITWLFSALNTVEPPIVALEQAYFTDRGRAWHDERQALLKDGIRVRLGQLSRRLGSADWLEGTFTAGDLMMIMVLRRAEDTGLLEEHPNLCDYIARGVARPAYQRAFAAQLAVFKAANPTT